MKSYVKLAFFAALPLALLMVFQPMLGGLGDPSSPKVKGTPKVPTQEVLPAVNQMLEPPKAQPPRTLSKRQFLENVERSILIYTNRERSKETKPTLLEEAGLRKTAREHAEDMVVRNYFKHVNPEGLGPMDRIAISHRTFIGLTGENLWSGSGFDVAEADQLAQKIVADWMGSEDHKANILKDTYTHLGVGVLLADGKIWAVQNFAQVVAYLQTPLPDRCLPGQRLGLTNQPSMPSNQAAGLFDFWSVTRGHAVSDPQNLVLPVPVIDYGTYKLRFYFPKENGYNIVYGPQIEVGQP